MKTTTNKMRNLIRPLRPVVIAAVAGAMVLSGTGARGQSLERTPLRQPIQQSDSVTVSRRSNCGFLSDEPVQVLQVTETFVSLDIAVNGSSSNSPNDISLLIRGSNGFVECLRSDPYDPGRIQAPGLLNQGRYAFFIGNSQPGTTTYTLSIRQD